MYQLLIGLIALIPVLALALGLIYFYLAFHRQKEEILATRAERLRRSHTFHYDANGNPEIIRNPETLALQIPPTGNPAYPATIIVRDSTQKTIKQEPERPLLLNINGGQRVANYGIEGEVIEASESFAETKVEPKLPISEAETRLYVENCIEKGIGKLDAARAISINPGGNKSYKAFDALWLSVVATKHVSPYLNQSSSTKEKLF